MKVRIDAYGKDHRPALVLLPETGAEWALLARVRRMERGGKIVQLRPNGEPGDWHDAMTFEMELSAEAREE